MEQKEAEWGRLTFTCIMTWAWPIRTTSLTFNNSAFCPHTVFMCSVWISEQTAIISLYNINWLVFITETECAYCAVRTGSLYTVSLTLSNSTFCPHTVFMCSVWTSEETAIISLFNINWLVFKHSFNSLWPSGYYMYRHFDIQHVCFLPTYCIYVFCVDLRKNSDYFPI